MMEKLQLRVLVKDVHPEARPNAPFGLSLTVTMSGEQPGTTVDDIVRFLREALEPRIAPAYLLTLERLGVRRVD